MDHSYDEWPKTEVQPAGMFFHFSSGMEMPVTVAGVAGRMRMSVSMDVHVALPGAIYRPYAKDDQHCGNADFESAAKRAGNVDLEKQDEASGECERECVARSPEKTDPTGPEKASFTADECGDRNDVIRVGCMLQPKKEAQAQEDK
jgi:hypothetical protein